MTPKSKSHKENERKKKRLVKITFYADIYEDKDMEGLFERLESIMPYRVYSPSWIDDKKETKPSCQSCLCRCHNLPEDIKKEHLCICPKQPPQQKCKHKRFALTDKCVKCNESVFIAFDSQPPQSSEEWEDCYIGEINGDVIVIPNWSVNGKRGDISMMNMAKEVGIPIFKFIKSLLAQQKEKLREKVEKLKGGHKFKHCGYCNGVNTVLSIIDKV